MPLVTRPATAGDQPFAYTVKRAALGTYVAQVWGWDEAAATLRRVAIRADCQRRGYGRRLLEAAEHFAHEHGCSRVESRVDPGAIGFYDRCGYTRVDSSDTSSSPLMAKTLT